MAIDEHKTEPPSVQACTSEGADEQAAVATNNQRPEVVGEHFTDLIAKVRAVLAQLIESNDSRSRVAACVS